MNFSVPVVLPTKFRAPERVVKGVATEVGDFFQGSLETGVVCGRRVQGRWRWQTSSWAMSVVSHFHDVEGISSSFNFFLFLS